jgi:hypothetical protein
MNTLRSFSSPSIYSPEGGSGNVEKMKEFDCVEMKWRIQQDLLREERELGKEEAKKRRRQRVLNDLILGPFLAKLAKKSRTGWPPHG